MSAGRAQTAKLVAESLNETSRLRQPSAIRALQPIMAQPGMISLGGGLPNPESFPFVDVSVRLRDGTKLDLDENEARAAFQYSPTQGLPKLVEQLRALQEREHGPAGKAGADWDVAVSTGSQDSLCKAFEMLLGPGKALLVEDPTYSGALAALRPLQCDLIPIKTDERGILPAHLREVLDAWDPARPKPPLYTIPVGQNPSGATLPADRKREIYAIACEHNLIVLEDDPYAFLQFGKPAPSFLSLDTDGRVLRFDSFSKVLSSGLRIGWATGHPALLNRIQLHSQVSSLHTSGISQMLVAKLLEQWGAAGWASHVSSVQSLYRERRDKFAALLDQHLGDHAEWTVPEAGMFFWLRIKGIDDTNALITQKAVEKKVLLLPGQVFSPTDDKSPYVRASFSVATDEAMEEALRRFAALLEEERKE